MRAAIGLLVVVGGAVAVAVASCGGDASSVGGGGAGTGPTDDGGDGGEAGDSAPTCASGKPVCDGGCADMTKDRKNCGACGLACKSGEACVASKCASSVGYAVRKVFLGETDRSGVTSSTAWQLYGENLDGLVTTKTSTDVCIRQPGAPSSNQDDGPGGLDNAWGKTIVPFLQPFAANPSADASSAIELGGRTAMLRMAGYTLGADTTSQETGFVFAEKALGPAWNGTDIRDMANAWTDGTLPLAGFPHATVLAGVFASGAATGPILFDVPFGAQALHLPIQKAHIKMKLAAGGVTATEGTISGIIATQDLEDALTKVAGYVSTQLCSGSTLDSIKQAIRQASDIMKDGTQNVALPCDGISFGIGFEAVAVTVGDVAPADKPQPDPCNP